MNSTERQLLLLLVAGIGLYIFMKKGLTTATAPATSAIANAWLYFDLPAPMNVLGNVVFPDGSTISINNLNVRGNSSTGQVAVNYQGHIYQLQPSDSNGNWPAVLVQ